MKANDPPAVISEAALVEKLEPCVKTLRLFVSILGAIAGNLALTGMTTGGIYIGGGIVPRILPILEEADFMGAFADKGRFRDCFPGYRCTLFSMTKPRCWVQPGVRWKGRQSREIDNVQVGITRRVAWRGSVGLWNYAFDKESICKTSVIARSETRKQSILAVWGIASGSGSRNDN